MAKATGSAKNSDSKKVSFFDTLRGKLRQIQIIFI
jgi:hypothetical protein